MMLDVSLVLVAWIVGLRSEGAVETAPVCNFFRGNCWIRPSWELEKGHSAPRI
jgi:hypothetical protein